MICIWKVVLIIGILLWVAIFLLWVAIACSQSHIQDRPVRHYPQGMTIAVIKAMREPSYKMLAKFDGLMIDDYQAMIDAITND